MLQRFPMVPTKTEVCYLRMSRVQGRQNVNRSIQLLTFWLKKKKKKVKLNFLLLTHSGLGRKAEGEHRLLQLPAAPAETVQAEQERLQVAPQLEPWPLTDPAFCRQLISRHAHSASLWKLSIQVPSSDIHSFALGAGLTITSHSPPDRDRQLLAPVTWETNELRLGSGCCFQLPSQTSPRLLCWVLS